MRLVTHLSSASLALAAAFSLCVAAPAQAADKPQALVDKAALSVQDVFVGATGQSPMVTNLAKAVP